MPYYFFFKQVRLPVATRWDHIETLEDHKAAAEKEKAYRTATLERGDPVVRRVHATTQEQAQEIIDKYGPR